MNWPKKSLLAIPEIYSCDGGGHGKTFIENHAETRVKIEAGALIAKVRKTAWPKNREELEDTNWLFEQFYEFESPTPIGLRTKTVIMFLNNAAECQR